jgi:adenylate cyclase
VWAHLQLGATLFWRGEPTESLHHLERTIALHDPGHFWLLPGAADPGVAARVYAGLALWQLGRPDRAVEVSEEGIELGRAKAHPFSLALALCFAAMLHRLCRDCERVHMQATEAITLSTEQEFPLWRGLGKVLLGWTMAQSANGNAAIEQIEQGLAELAATGTEVGAPGALLLLAEAQRSAGRDADALGSIQLGLEIATGKHQHSWEAELLRLQGEALGAQRAAEAEASLRRALDVARRQQARSLELRAAMGLGRLLNGQGRKADAHHLLAPILQCFTEGFETQDVRDAQALLKDLS